MRPVVLIPGIGGSILVRTGNEKRQLFHKSVPANRWVNIYSFTQKEIDKWKHETRSTIVENGDGKIVGLEPTLPIHAYDMGGTEGIKDIIPEFLLLPKGYYTLLEELFKFRYFHAICDFLYKHGYRDHHTLFGAPYDFRMILDPKTRKTYFLSLKHMIEKAVAARGEKAVIVSHSMGGMLFKWFASEIVTQEWIDMYIERWVCINSPFGGSYQALRTVTCGDHYIASYREHVQSELQYVTGIVMCIPNSLAYEKDEPLLHLQGNKRIITLDEYEVLAKKDKNLPFRLWKDLYEPNHKWIEKKVAIPTDAVFSVHKETYGVAFAENITSEPHRICKVAGDGMVPARSLKSIDKILDHRHLKEHITNHDHTSILSAGELMRIIRNAANF